MTHHPPPTTHTDWAIVVGVWDYPDLGDLAGPEHDARAFANWVQAPEGGGVPADHVRLILSSDYAPAELARAAQPTDAQVMAVFDELDDLAQSNRDGGEGLRVGRRLYLYLAGHGCAPALDESVLLMANATRRRAGYHIPGKPWANWFYRAGYFDELLLFMDCCRESYPQAALNVPGYIDITAQDAVDRGRRFFAFATKWSRLSRERPMADGVVRGVFTSALLKGLSGEAADGRGRVTAGSLAGYLLTGMKEFLSPEDLEDPEIPKAPDIEMHPVIDPEFVIVRVRPRELQRARSVPVQEARLAVKTGDAATEIFVVDNQLRVVVQGAGQLEAPLATGRYLVKVRAGEATAEAQIDLTGDGAETTFAPLSFASPVPLLDTAASDERARQAAIAQSRQPHLATGEGAEIFAMARVWGAAGKAGGVADAGVDPMRGLLLLDAAGATVADLAGHAWRDPEEPQIAACTVAVAPGEYRLALELSGGRRLERTVVASAGWQTQLFLLHRAVGAAGADRRAMLTGAAMLMTAMAGGDRFDPARREARLVELARLGLTNRRQVLSPELRELLREQLADPMLGLLGGHLLLLDPSPDLGLLETIVATLRGQFGGIRHPDVEALALQLPDGAAGDFTFSTPPMLRQSWTLILDATAARANLLPADATAAKIATRVWGEAPWLLWETEPGGALESFALGEEPGPDFEFEAALDRQIADLNLPPPGNVEFAPGGRSELPEIDEATIRRLVRTLGLPRSRVEEMLAKR
jgi:hypothetical protein